MHPYRISLWLFALFVAVPFACATAQTTPVAREPHALATAALAGLPGTAAAGMLKDKQIRIAVQGVAKGAAAEPIFEIGSVSKVFTGLLLALAVEAGELSLDDSIGSVLGASVAFESRHTAGITLRQLVTHTSCLPFLPESVNVVPAGAQINQSTRADLWAALGKFAPARPAPCESLYSNFGMAVLAELLAQRAGRPWMELVRARITVPLGMHDTFVKVPARHASRLVDGFIRDVPARHWLMEAYVGAGGVRSTATDLLIFSRALLQGRQGPLGAAAERLVTDLAPYGKGTARIGYAVILPAAPEPVWAHNGITGGQVAEWIVWPQRREAVVMLVSNVASPAPGIARGLIIAR